LAVGVAQPAAKTAMTTKHPSRRTLAPWLSRACSCRHRSANL
jgi:hypothetical protein